MTPERWQRIKEIFSAASALPEEERRTYVELECRADPALSAEVQSLLAAHGEARAVVDQPAVAHIASEWLASTTTPRIGRQIGPYEITALIGHGGMGSVYRARRVDDEYEKEVAIKLVPGGYQAGFVLQRLRVERQILANLDHPNIARLIDGGATDDGSPYLVMELVDGEPIDRHAASRDLSIRERLQLFRHVCAAVSYAHQRLVVHRDLKPSNILVTPDGTVKLLDFGIAKLLQPATGEGVAEPTVTLMHALTPAFSSPEQILGRPITTASDVYSLGVVLYVLLTGRSPYRAALDTAQDAIREVCEAEPLRPSAVVGDEHLDRDLDAITLRALRKEPDKRYASVEQLADDVRRYLDGSPVLARGDRLSYRTGKLLRRRKLELGAAGLVALTLGGGIVASLHEARIAAEQERRAEQQRQRAERHFASVRRLANAFMFKVHDAIEALPGATGARELLVATALEYLDTLAAEAGGDRELELELADAYTRIGGIQGNAHAMNTGAPHAALDSYARAIALLEPIVAADPDSSHPRSVLASAHLEQSRLLLLLGEPTGALAASARGVAMLESLAASQPEARVRLRLAAAYADHAYTLDMAGGQDEAGAEHARKAVAILEQIAEEAPDDTEVAFELGNAYTVLGTTMLAREHEHQALLDSLALHRKALEIDERIVEDTGGRNARYVRAAITDRNNIARQLYELGDYRGAVENARAAEPLLARLMEDARDAQIRIDAANLDWHLARALLALAEVDEAAAILERSIATLEAIAREGDTLKVQYLLGATAGALGAVHAESASRGESDSAEPAERWSAAQRWYRRAIAHFENVTANVSLDHLDQRPVDEAIAGLAAATAAIAELETAH